MREYTHAELSYLLQEGKTANAEAREALVHGFAGLMLSFAHQLASDDDDPAEAAFALTAITFHQALSNTDNLQLFDSLQNWLFAEMLNAHPAARGKKTLLGHAHPAKAWTILLLRYGFQLSTPHISEITGKDEHRVLKILRKARGKYLNHLRPGGNRHLAAEIENAVDGQSSWQSFGEEQSHLNDCPECSRYLSELQDLENQLAKAFDPPSDTLTEQKKEKLLAFIQEKPDNIRIKSKRRRPREALWLFGALAFFFISALALNPFWTPPAPTPTPTPTLPAPESLTDQVRSMGYQDLERALLYSPVPIWQPGSVQLSDWQPTTRVSFSPDGAFAAFGSEKTVILIDLARSTQIQLNGHTENVQSIAFADHNWLASADAGGTMRLWDVDLRSTRYFLSKEFSIRSFALSPDGAYIAAAAEDLIRIWQFSGQDLVRMNDIALEKPLHLAIAGDNSRLAVVDAENVISVWQLSDSSLLLRFEAGQYPVEKIQFSPNGNRLAISDSFGRVSVYGFSQPIGGKFDGIRIFAFDNAGALLDFNWTHDDNYLALLQAQGPGEPPVILLREMSTGLPAALPYTISEHPSIDTFAITRNGEMFAADANGLLAFPIRTVRTDHPLPTEFNLAKTNVYPLDLPMVHAPDPFSLDYPDTLGNVAAQIAPALPLEELIPDEYSFIGALFDPTPISASFTFTRALITSSDATIILKIRPRSAGEPLIEMDDWIGADADFDHIQIGRHLGERVTGRWETSTVDKGAPNIYRWTPEGLTRFRWTQDGYLFELISQTTLSTESGRWNRLFQPLATALIRLEHETPTLQYVVETGDTCTSIAARFGATIGILTSMNNLGGDCAIFVGDTLTLPVPPPVGLFTETDLDCDGSLEQIRLIPDPLEPNTDDKNLGLVIDALPGAGRVVSARHVTFDQLSISDLSVDFFGPPQLTAIEDVCGKLIAITGYGGSDEDSGLRLLVWTGEALRLILDTDGFPVDGFTDTIREGYTFTTQRLIYEPNQAACNLVQKTFTWKNNAFAVTGEETIFGVDCFEEQLP